MWKKKRNSNCIKYTTRNKSVEFFNRLCYFKRYMHYQLNVLISSHIHLMKNTVHQLKLETPCWRRDVETSSALLALCHRWLVDSPHKGPAMDKASPCFFLSAWTPLNKKSSHQRFETPWRSCDVIVMVQQMGLQTIVVWKRQICHVSISGFDRKLMRG